MSPSVPWLLFVQSAVGLMIIWYFKPALINTSVINIDSDDSVQCLRFPCSVNRIISQDNLSTKLHGSFNLFQLNWFFLNANIMYIWVFVALANSITSSRTQLIIEKVVISGLYTTSPVPNNKANE